MSFEITRQNGNSHVKLPEKLTIAEVPEFQAALKQEIAEGAVEIIFDMAETISLDSTGIGLLIATNNSLSPLHGTIRLINVMPDILKLLRSMRLVERLHATASAEVPRG